MDVIDALATQSLARELTPEERCLADALFAIFGAGTHDFEDVARELEKRKVQPPSGDTASWSVEKLQNELAMINRKLDEAYDQESMNLNGAAVPTVM